MFIYLQRPASNDLLKLLSFVRRVHVKVNMVLNVHRNHEAY